jgi:hypothetical protein
MSNSTNKDDNPSYMLAHKRVLTIMKASSGVTLSEAILFLRLHGLLSDSSIIMKDWNDISDQIPENWKPKSDVRMSQVLAKPRSIDNPIYRWRWYVSGVTSNNQQKGVAFM